MPINIDTVPESFRNKIDAKDRKELGIRTREEVQFNYDEVSERELQNQIADYLNVKDIVAFQQRMDRKSNMVLGAPDFLCCYQTVPLAFECKVGTNKQTPEQNRMELAMTRNGWRYYIIRNLSEVRAILTAIEVGYES